MDRSQTRKVYAGKLEIGGNNHIVIQTMLTQKTANLLAIKEELSRAQAAGAEMIRVSILDEDDARAIKEIKKFALVPIVADIHFDYRLALLAIENGIDKIRINPGNIGKKENIIKLVEACKKHHIPIRIGINGGSLEKDILEKYTLPTAEALIESAKRHVEILESLDFYDIVISLKTSSVVETIKAYQTASTIFPYPLHIGITEAGPLLKASIKTAAGLGTLLYSGIGNTIRASLTSSVENEIKVCKEILAAFNLIEDYPNLISCPTCGRTQIQLMPIVDEIEQYLANLKKNITVAIMGCVVNGPGEAREADIGIAGGKGEAILFKKGKIIRKIAETEIIETLKQEIDKL